MENNKNTIKRTTSEYIRIFVYVLAAILLLLIIGSVLSKYVYNNKGQSLITAHEFYFTSDYLTEENQEYILSSDTTEIQIILKNHEDNLRYSSDEVKYSVLVNGTEKKSGNLEANQKSSDKITISGLQNGETYEVVATGSAGFKKTIRATFRVLAVNENVYKSVKNTDEYVLLTVWAESLSGNLTIDFSGASVIPDNTETVMSNTKTSDGSFEDTVNFKEKFSSHSYRFFKSTSASVSADSFEVTLNGVTATTKNPEK